MRVWGVYLVDLKLKHERTEYILHYVRDRYTDGKTETETHRLKIWGREFTGKTLEEAIAKFKESIR